MKRQLLLLAVLLGCLTCTVIAQTTVIKGTVVNSATAEPLIRVSVRLKNSTAGTMTDSSGQFLLSVPSLPASIILSHSGFDAQEITVSNGNRAHYTLSPSSLVLEGVLLASKGIPTMVLEAAFSAEMIGLKQIRNLPATSAYDATVYTKGIDITSSGLLFKTPSTRGFNGSGSTRVNQLVDGMDNQAPGLNFFVGNFNGPSDLDLESIEILPGASSALYGPGGMNGTILINSKNPFTHPGLSVSIKQGMNHVDKRQRNNAGSYSDYAFRYAKTLGDKWAFKIGAHYIRAIDWLANDSSNYLRSGTSGKLISGNRVTDPNYDGVNVYGDETSVDLRPFVRGAAMSYPPGHPFYNAILQLYNSMQDPTPVSRTGYAEKDIIDPETFNLKLNGALHYKIGKNTEAILMANWSTGNTVYTDDNRYSLKGIKIGQYKLEVRNKNWFLRSYTTQEDAGEAFSATVATQLFNEAWKRSYDSTNLNGSWYVQYAGAFIQTRLGGGSPATAHAAGRAVADQGRPEAGSANFRQLFDKVRSTPIPNGGLFKEKSQLWMNEGQYRFGDASKNAELIVGGNFKRYILNSYGTLFIDTLKAITINETGAYLQVTRKLWGDKLTLTASGRFDKNANFKAQFTPRAALLFSVAKEQRLRLSYQTAYRFPGNLSQWIRLDVGGDYMLLGGLPWVMEYMQADKYPVYEIGANGQPASTAFVYKPFNPETMRSFELGYKGLIQNRLLVDAYAYLGKYEDFIGRIGLFQPATGKAYSIVVNSSNSVKTHGFGLGLDYRMKKNFSAFFNLYSDVITDVPAGFKSYFNAPKYRFNAGLANSGLGKKQVIGFNIMMRWQDGFNWEGELANGPLPAFATADAQVSFNMKRAKSVIRIGGTNIFNRYYKNAYANPVIGGLYYVSYIYNF